MDEEIQRFISIFDHNKRIDFTKVLTNDITRSEYAVLWMYKNMAQNSDVVYVSDIVKKFPASAQALSKHLRTCENKGYTLFQGVMSMIMHLPEFKELHRYYTTRAKNPLKGKQSKVALCCKVIRIFYVLLNKGVEYDSQKLMKDIVRPEVIAA